MNSFGQRLCRFSNFLLVTAVLSTACQENASTNDQTRDPRTGLTEVESAQVLAEVGSAKITLGEYAESLLRMGEYEQLRYQSKERQLELLNDLIDLELFAQEARRLELDQRPEVQIALDQAQRDQALANLKKKSITPDQISEAEIKSYYDAHRDEFKEPERRRVLAISFKDRSKAENLLEKVKGADGKSWGRLVRPFLKNEGIAAAGATEYSGDLGFTSAVGVMRGRNENIPDAVVEAVFTLKNNGDVYPSPVGDADQFYVVRLAAKSPARDRSLSSASPLIRVELARKHFLKLEEELIKELRQRYPVKIIP